MDRTTIVSFLRSEARCVLMLIIRDVTICLQFPEYLSPAVVQLTKRVEAREERPKTK
jgi:hypothetical protein